MTIWYPEKQKSPFHLIGLGPFVDPLETTIESQGIWIHDAIELLFEYYHDLIRSFRTFLVFLLENETHCDLLSLRACRHVKLCSALDPVTRHVKVL